MALSPIGGVAGAAQLIPPGAAGTGGPSFGALLEARSARIGPGGAETPGAPAAAAALHGLEAIEQAQSRLDDLLAAARAGRTFTPQELLGLQASAYRYAQAVELGARLVEQGTQAVKQALHAQV